jgi:hypothetical protein
LVLSLGIVVIVKGNASAATINVSAGTDTIAVDSSCHLSEAIQNINDQAQTNIDCPAGDGNEDTINLPEGMIMLSGDTPEIVRSMVIQGQGMTQTIINGGAAVYSPLKGTEGTLQVFDLRISEFERSAISANEYSNLIAERIQIDTSYSNAYTIDGINFSNVFGDDTVSRSVSLKDIYIHSLSTNTQSVNGILISPRNSGTIDADLENITIASLSSSGVNGIAQGIVLTPYSPELTPGNVNANLQNITINDINAADDVASGITAFATVNGGASQIDVNARNMTITNIDGVASMAWGGESGSGLSFAGIAIQPSDEANVTVDLWNTLIATGSDTPSCASVNIGSLFGGVGNFNHNVYSQGGNISADDSCNDYFDQSGDQTEIADLATTLGSLSDNGGSVPTIPLLPGSLAIDSGLAVIGLTTDARGVSRPQCANFDSGSYEYNGTCPVVEQADISLEGWRETPAPITSGTQLTYNLKIKNNGPGVSYDEALYMLINTPENTTLEDIIVDNLDDYSLECGDQGPIEAFNGGIYNSYTGNAITCVVSNSNDYIDVDEELNLTLRLSATSDFTLGVEILRAAAFNPFSNQDSDFAQVLDGFLQGTPIFEISANNIINLTYGVNDTPSSGTSDPDPIPDTVENAAPNNGDANNDGTPDSQQPHVTSVPIPSGPQADTYITLAAPTGTTISAAAVEQATDLATKDVAYDYPLGLLSFTVDDVTLGSTIPIELYYYTNLSPNSLTPRKYNPTTQAFTTLSTQTETNLTQTTIDNQPVLKLTYNLTDGGTLDIDNQANGSIQDPVGLAKQTTGSANTGIPRYWLLGVK